MSKFSLIVDQRYEFQADSDRRVSRNWLELSSLSEEKLITLLQGMQNFDEINWFFMINYQNKIGIFVKLTWKVSMRWKNWSDFKGLNIRWQFRGENWSKIEIPSLNSRPEFRNCRMKWIVWMIREFLKMLNQYAVDYPTLPVNLRYSHLFEILAECYAVLWECQAATTHSMSGNVFVNPTASSSAPYPQGFNPWISNVSEHTSPHVTTERQTPDTTLDPRCQSGPSARNSFHPKEGRFSKNYGADQQRLQISDLHFDKFRTPATFACWKIRFKTEVCTCSQFPTEAMLWIKEVEMVESVDDLKSSCSIERNSNGPEFWGTRRENCFSTEQSHPEYQLQEKRQSEGNESSQRRTVSFEEDRLRTWSTSTSASLEPTILSRIMPTYLQQLFFEMMIFRNSIRNGTKFYYRWRKSHLMTSWKGLYKLRIRESEKLKTVLEFTIWRFIRRKLDLIIIDWRQW